MTVGGRDPHTAHGAPRAPRPPAWCASRFGPWLMVAGAYRCGLRHDDRPPDRRAHISWRALTP